MKIEHNYVLVDNVNIHYVVAGTNKKSNLFVGTFIFLHGFPEYWQTWQAQLDYFSAKYRVIAPDLPGYNLSDKPSAVSFYSIPRLIKFIACFIETVCPNEKIYLIAHDWGGVIAWPLTAFYPQLIEKLIILNAAHPSIFTREMIGNPEQRRKSGYIHDLINETSEQLLSKNNYHYLSEKIMVSAKTNVFTAEIKEKYRQVWQQIGAVNGMLQYYRAMPQLAAINKRTDNYRSESYNQILDKKNNTQQNVESIGPIKNTSNMTIPNIRINVPTLILWGELDQAFVIENLVGIEQYVPNCTVKRFADASHWLHHEKSAEINQAIADFIN